MSENPAAELLQSLLIEFNGHGISDIQIRSNRLVYLHTKGGLEIATGKGVMAVETVEAIAEWLYSQQVVDQYRSRNKSEQEGSALKDRLCEDGVLDFGCEGLPLGNGKSSGRMRVQAHLSSSGLGLTCRLLNEAIPSLDGLGLSDDTCFSLKGFVNRRQGLGLVTGQTGSGKSTTLAALINWLREHQSRHIVTVEDPIEYRYPTDMPDPKNPGVRVSAPGFVTQQQVGQHVASYQQGLKDVLRKAPHVILLGEIRDRETMNICIEAAQTGHVVISTLHTNGAVKTLSRILEFFPRDQHKALLSRLSEILMFILSQGLVVGRERKVLNYEFLQNNNPSVRSGIAHYDGEARSLEDVIKLSGNVEWDTHLAGLLRRGIISEEAFLLNRMNSDEEGKPFIGQRAIGF